MIAALINGAKALLLGWLQSVLFIGWSALCVAVGAALAFVALIGVLNALGIPL